VPLPSSVCSFVYRTRTDSPAAGVPSISIDSVSAQVVNGTRLRGYWPTGYSAASTETRDASVAMLRSRLPALVVSVVEASRGAASDTSCTARAMWRSSSASVQR